MDVTCCGFMDFDGSLPPVPRVRKVHHSYAILIYLLTRFGGAVAVYTFPNNVLASMSPQCKDPPKPAHLLRLKRKFHHEALLRNGARSHFSKRENGIQDIYIKNEMILRSRSS